LVAINPNTGKKYCDLFCFMCEGFVLKPCVMTDTGDSMRMLMANCMGHGILLDDYEPTSEYWKEYLVLTPDVVENAGEYPVYVLQKKGVQVRETCH